MRMFSTTILLLFIASSSGVHAQRVIEARMELLQTGQPARVPNPDCTDQPSFDAGRLVAQLGAAAIDAYVGYPVATPLVQRMDQGQFNWFSARMGLHNGGAHCATQCIIVPAAAYRTVERKSACPKPAAMVLNAILTTRITRGAGWAT